MRRQSYKILLKFIYFVKYNRSYDTYQRNCIGCISFKKEYSILANYERSKDDVTNFVSQTITQGQKHIDNKNRVLLKLHILQTKDIRIRYLKWANINDRCNS